MNENRFTKIVLNYVQTERTQKYKGKPGQRGKIDPTGDETGQRA
jgi:hypothetical protein